MGLIWETVSPAGILNPETQSPTMIPVTEPLAKVIAVELTVMPVLLMVVAVSDALPVVVLLSALGCVNNNESVVAIAPPVLTIVNAPLAAIAVTTVLVPGVVKLVTTSPTWTPNPFAPIFSATALAAAGAAAFKIVPNETVCVSK